MSKQIKGRRLAFLQISIRYFVVWDRLYFGLLTLRDGTERLSLNVGIYHYRLADKSLSRLRVKIRWKRFRLDFRDQDGILLIDYRPKGQTIKA
jgi:hypothetical protein